jgi:(p)ppGpp synthase/HD superfamily hydrolase
MNGFVMAAARGLRQNGRDPSPGDAAMQDLTDAYDLAARRHCGQSRKGASQAPYVNHVIDVAARVARSSHGPDRVLILAAILHDTVEDTDTTPAEIAERFGPEVAALVMEVTDDMSRPKAARRRAQVLGAPGSSDRAKRLKLADKASNLTALAEDPPDWPKARRADYVDWAVAVIAGYRGVDPRLEAEFDEAVARARARLGL